jgi:acetylornithine/N-succinyldiaminopimelate aminotransferase
LSNASVIERAQKVLFPNYRQAPIALKRGLGSRVWDADGKEYLDFLGGIAVTVLGHNHPSVRAAAQAQLDQLWHTSNLYFTEPQVELAERLTSDGYGERAFFCNSGAEANEGALKLIRKYQRETGHTERFEVLCADNSFHGRTMGALAATGQPKYHHGFEPLVEGFRHLPFGDLKAFENAVTPRTAGILIECIQGEAGVYVPEPGFIAGLRKLADTHGLLLAFDEVQGGFGRTGKLWSFEWEGVAPDIFTLAKGIANGLPMGALLAKAPVAQVFQPGTHASTFGGNPVTAAAAVAVYDELTKKGALDRGRVGAERLWGRLRELQKKSNGVVADVRGRGMWIGIVLAEDRASRVVTKSRELGLLVNGIGEKTLRLAPSLLMGDAEIDRGAELLAEAIRTA